MTVQSIFMTGEAGYHNLGDEGMALASASRLRRYFPDAQLVATGFDPLGAVLRQQAKIVPWPLTQYSLPFTHTSGRIRKIGRKLGASEDFLDPAGRPFDRIFAKQYRDNPTFRDVLQTMERADLMFDMGHGGLTDVFDPFTLCFFYYLAGRLGKPLFLSGQSVGPLWRRRSMRMVRSALQYAHTVGLRDKGVSYDVLVKQVGIDPGSTRLIEVGDDTLDLAPEEPARGIVEEPIRRLLTGGQFFAIQWRSTDYAGKFAATEHLVPLVEAVGYLYRQTGLIPVFVPMSWEASGDVLAAVRVRDFIQDAFPCEVVWHALTPAQAKWLLGQAKFGIGLSYHFNVFLLSQGLPSIALYTNDYYDIKARGVFAAFGLTATPPAYRPGLVDDVAFRECAEVALAWDEKQRTVALDAARAQRDRWHAAFRQFMLDHGLT